MVKTDVAAGKPPLDRAAEGGASAPAVRVAVARAAAGIMDSLQNRPRDLRRLLRVPLCHFALVCRKSAQNLFLLTLRHLEGVECSAELSRDLVELCG